jgi:predicted Ser/Thr protein kinase
MSNPYVSRGPVRTREMFFGRIHELNEIAAFVHGNQSISIIGPRKIGKTSLLYHLIRPGVWPEIGLDSNSLFVYLDCEVLGESTHEELFAQFAAEMSVSLDGYGLPAEPALDAVVAKPSRLSFEAAVRKLNQRGLRVVLILDEFERLSTNPHLNLNFFNALRSAAGRYQLVFLTASARPLIELTYSGHSQEILSSPFFNIFAPLFLGLMPEGEARRLICEPACNAGRNFPPVTENFIYTLAGGHPLALQVACFHAYDMPDYDGTSEIEQRTVRELSAHFQYYWRNLSPVEQDALRSLSDAVTRAAGDTTLRAALRDLVQKCLLVTQGDVYVYPSQAWADFVAIQNPATPNPSRVGGALTGVVFGPYEVQELLGRGGMAEVYKGHHHRLERAVAIKVLSASLAAEGDFRKRFEREARAIATLRHPNIVQVYDFGDIEGVYYMVMEYIDGDNLATLLGETGPLGIEQVRPIARDLASALDYAHGQGIIHRDVKPSNVMIHVDSNSFTHAILTDFGIAKILRGDPSPTKDGGLTGTLDYMAPEQIRGSGDVDSRADVYALGVMLYQMFTGQLPFKGDNAGAVLMGHLQGQADDPRVLAPELPTHIAIAIMRALAKERDERFQTVGELAAELD